MIPSNVISQVTGTGASIKVAIGYVPDRVVLTNRTTGRTLSWFRGQGNGAGITSGPGVTSDIVSGAAGVGAMNDPQLGDGFTIGTDTINAAGQVIDFIAERSGPGGSNT